MYSDMYLHSSDLNTEGLGKVGWVFGCWQIMKFQLN